MPNKITKSEQSKSKWLDSCSRTKVREAQTSWGLPIKVMYEPDDIEHLDLQSDLGYPGQFPFTRGVYPTMYRGRPWTIRQYAGFGTPRETNERYRFLLSEGETGLSVAFDLPTQLGYDSDHPDVREDVGRVGVAVDTLRDLEVVFQDIPIDKVSTSFTINATAPIILAMYIALAEKQGISQDRLMGTLQNDILKEYAARGTYIFPPEPSLKLTVDIIEYCTRYMPRFNPISVCGAHFRDAGANEPQELAFILLDAMTYVEKTLERGLAVDDFAPRLSFNSLTLIDFFQEVAKYRAARRIWARIMKDQYGAKKPESMRFRLFAGCGGGSLTAQEPENNIVRVASEAIATALGGMQAMHTCGWDEAFAIPTQESVRIATRTQQIIALETGITNTVDPLAGSYYVEYLTDEIEKEVQRIMAQVNRLGGMVTAIKDGWVQREILKTAYEFEKQIQSGERPVVGLNCFRSEGSQQDYELHEWNERSWQEQVARLAQVRKERDEEQVNLALARLRQTMENGENMMPTMIEVVKCYATLGEIVQVMKQVLGEYRMPVAL